MRLRRQQLGRSTNTVRLIDGFTDYTICNLSVAGRNARKDKTLFFASGHTALLEPDADGQPRGFVKVAHDRLGHAAGDDVLADFARVLERCLRPGDMVARAGGDEFTILVTDVNTVKDALSIAERIHCALLKPFALAGKQVKMTASIGIAVASSLYQTANHVLRDADTAMYQAKGRGGAQHAVFPERKSHRLPARSHRKACRPE